MSKQPRKRRRIDSKEEMKSMMKELVREMVPVIVDLVTSKLSPGSFVQTGSVTQSQEQDDCASRQTQASIHVTQSAPVANVALPTSSEHTASTCTSDNLQQTSVASQNQTSKQGNNIDITGPLHSGRPLGQGVDSKIKSKIWVEEYIQLGSLLYKPTYAKLEAVQDSDNNITFLQKEHIFVSIYCQKFPALSSNLMKYMAIIHKLYHDVGEKAGLYYDEHFRIWRGEHPNTMHWDQINPELHAEALQIGVKTKLDMLGKQSKNDSQRLFS